MDEDDMDETQLEQELCSKLRAAMADHDILREFKLHHSTSEATTLYDLVGATEYEVIEDDSRWNPYPSLLVDLCGGMTLDIVLRSRVSGQNRVYIEVKTGGAIA